MSDIVANAMNDAYPDPVPEDMEVSMTGMENAPMLEEEEARVRFPVVQIDPKSKVADFSNHPVEVRRMMDGKEVTVRGADADFVNHMRQRMANRVILMDEASGVQAGDPMDTNPEDFVRDEETGQIRPKDRATLEKHGRMDALKKEYMIFVDGELRLPAFDVEDPRHESDMRLLMEQRGIPPMYKRAPGKKAERQENEPEEVFEFRSSLEPIAFEAPERNAKGEIVPSTPQQELISMHVNYNQLIFPIPEEDINSDTEANGPGVAAQLLSAQGILDRVVFTPPLAQMLTGGVLLPTISVYDLFARYYLTFMKLTEGKTA